jgi:CRP/FNR family transcriptional regulator, anaerobic regulatory protein
MTEAILKSVKSIVRLNPTEEEALLNTLELKKFKKNQLLLREGAVCNSILFIVKGCIRYFYVKDGEEITGQFFIENEWFTDYESFLTQLPSEINIQALEPCTILIIPKKKIDQLFLDFPIFERFGRLMAEQAFLGLRNKNKKGALLSSTERYQSFAKNRPEIVQRVAQHYIASYLGMQPQSLSRIRGKLLKKPQ